MRVLLDSSILVRANHAGWGIARELLIAIIETGNTLLVSYEILFETAKVLRYPRFQARYGLSEESIYQYISYLQTVGVVIDIDPTFHVPLRDANDIHVAQAAILGEADVLCTQDDDLSDETAVLFLARFKIRVVSDRELVRLLKPPN